MQYIVEMQAESKLNSFHTSFGGEYVSAEMKAFISKHVIWQLLKVSGDWQQDGISRRLNLTLLNFLFQCLVKEGLASEEILS